MQRAVAGELEIPLFGETVMLNAGNSYDPNGDGVAYEWSRVDLVLDDAPHAREIPSVPSVQHEPGSRWFSGHDCRNLFCSRCLVSDGRYTVSHTMTFGVEHNAVATKMRINVYGALSGPVRIWHGECKLLARAEGAFPGPGSGGQSAEERNFRR